MTVTRAPSNLPLGLAITGSFNHFQNYPRKIIRIEFRQKLVGTDLLDHHIIEHAAQEECNNTYRSLSRGSFLISVVRV